ncbi:MAG: arginase family protein [Chitinophagaceae bacterium]
MSDSLHIADFLQPIHLGMLSDDEGYKDGQLGKKIDVYEEELPDVTQADLVLIGCGEQRGSGVGKKNTNAPDIIRGQLYTLYGWHDNIRIADIGNVITGASLNDTYAALKTVIGALTDIGKTVVILGGSHDLTLAQYSAYTDRKQVIEAACVDSLINLDMDSRQRDHNFLMEMLTGEPNFIRHYNHIGFQSYYVHPHMLETMDKLRFDCFRVGQVRENIEEMEPAMRSCELVSFDIAALANAYAPANLVTPNGFTGEDACILMRYAGLSPHMNTLGIYGYEPVNDRNQLTAKQISHMLWYLVDGRSRAKREANLEQREFFNEFHIAFAEIDTMFLQSKKTGRWWMQLPDKTFIPCSYKDYMLASSNEIPERWFRAQERN